MKKSFKRVVVCAMLALSVFTLTACKYSFSISDPYIFDEPFRARIYFDSNGGSSVEHIIAPESMIITLPAAPTKEGFAFMGWFYEDEKFKTPFDGAIIPGKCVSGKMTVYAKWETAYKITVIAEHGAITPSQYEAASGSEITLTVTPDEGYEFLEHSIECNGERVYGLTFTMPSEDVTLTAYFRFI